MKKTLLALSACMTMGATGFAQLTENFESTTGTALPATWTQEVAAGTPSTSLGWNSGTNTTLGTSTFPMYTHTRYVAVNDNRTAGTNNSASRLVSPTFSLASGVLQWLKFECSYVPDLYSWVSESAKVEISTDGGTTWTTLTTLTGNETYWWEPRFVDLSAYAGMSGLKLSFLYSDNGGNALGWGIDDIETFSPPTAELELQATAPTANDPAAYGLAGASVSILGQVKNNGGTAVTSYDVKYLFNGGSVVTNTIAGTIAPFTTATFTATTPVTLPSAVGAYPIRVWVELAGDVDNTNDSAGHDSLYTVAFMPTKRMVVEEGTGTWCQWCPRGAVYMDSLNTLHGDDVSLIAVHNNDPMEVTAYDTWMGGQIGGYPSAVVDRRLELDPGNLIAAYNAFHDDFSFADITAVPTFAGTSLTATVNVRPATTIRNTKLAWVITEDELSGTTSSWNQANAYSGNPTPMVGGGYNFNTLPNPVPASVMKYNHVARSIDPSPTGTNTLLPAVMVASTDYTCTISKTLDASWVTNKIHGVVMLLGSDGSVLNSANFTSTTGISDVNAGVENLVVVPNPASTQATVVFDLKNSGSVQINVFDVMGRVVYSVPSANLGSGTNRIVIPATDLANGMYHVKINTEAGTITEKFNVIK